MNRPEIILNSIGFIESPFKERFAVPNQAVRLKHTRMKLILHDSLRQSLEGIESWSHLWVMTYFHLHKSFKSKVRPPRLGGKVKMGVLATRSPERPNPIGLSLVEIIDYSLGKDPWIEVRGGDWVDGTPLLDIKPYLPYSDKPQGTKVKNPFHEVAFSKLKVSLSKSLKAKLGKNLKAVVEIIALDPRPANQKEKKTDFGFLFNDLNIRFQVKGTAATVLEVRIIRT